MEIKTTYGSGGANINPRQGSPSLPEVLRDIADDLAGVKAAGTALAADTVGAALAAFTAATVGADIAAFTAATVGADIAAFTDPPSAAEMALLRTFVNALKADNATLRSELGTLRTFVNALKADHATALSELGTARGRINEIRVDLLDVRAKGAAVDAYTLLTTKG